ncbi:hypothetical protein PAXRUDRAFT_782919, partial [Paxillus rubicundulus Ve08.2h10]
MGELLLFLFIFHLLLATGFMLLETLHFEHLTTVQAWCLTHQCCLRVVVLRTIGPGQCHDG